jgi:dTDP-4-amino-4,6-dideoxygalactose transaminase
MFIVNPDPYNIPSYRIGTFVTSFIARNAAVSNEWMHVAYDYFDSRFGQGNWLVTKNGREAMAIALKELQLPEQASVTILTPSQNLYISSCVTSTIEKFTQWNRKTTENTCAYFINHEFGYLFSDISALAKSGLSVIEDCCTTFFSQDAPKRIGLYGNYSLFSFPKFFGIQFGGLLVGKGVGLSAHLKEQTCLLEEEKKYILKVVGFELSQMEIILEKRKAIHDYACKKFSAFGFTLRFPNKDGIVPSVLLLNNNGIIRDLQKHKEYLYAHGIQNSVFYGEDAFFIPCHQNITKVDVDYFTYLVRYFIENQT